jgi:hypothetical protein
MVKRKIPRHPPGIEPQNPDCPAHSLVTIPTELSRVLSSWCGTCLSTGRSLLLFLILIHLQLSRIRLSAYSNSELILKIWNILTVHRTFWIWHRPIARQQEIAQNAIDMRTTVFQMVTVIEFWISSSDAWCAMRSHDKHLTGLSDGLHQTGVPCSHAVSG